jgi:nucleoside phosphorylase
MLLLVFALPEEARALRRRIRWQQPKESGFARPSSVAKAMAGKTVRQATNGRESESSMVAVSRGVFAGQEVSLSFVGIGGAAIDQVELAAELVKPQLIISSGFAGATRSLLEPGDFILSTNYTDPDVEKILSNKKIVDASGPFVQVKQVASVSDKWSLNRSVRSIAVDMESELMADLCRRKQISLVTARMISDAIDETIPALFTRRKVSRLSDLSDAVSFAARMLRLTGKLADRLEVLVGACCEAAKNHSKPEL